MVQDNLTSSQDLGPTTLAFLPTPFGVSMRSIFKRNSAARLTQSTSIQVGIIISFLGLPGVENSDSTSLRMVTSLKGKSAR
jgi:hypothetical protein